MNRVRGLISDLHGDTLNYISQMNDSEVTIKLGDAVILARKIDALNRAIHALQNTATRIYNGNPIYSK